VSLTLRSMRGSLRKHQLTLTDTCTSDPSIYAICRSLDRLHAIAACM
jgi:hypothetical protein